MDLIDALPAVLLGVLFTFMVGRVAAYYFGKATKEDE